MKHMMREYPDREGFECCECCGQHLYLDRNTNELRCPNGCESEEEDEEEEDEEWAT